MICKQYVYERKLFGIRSDGGAIDITVALGVPYKDNNLNSWACPVLAEGLFNGLATLRGINSWRAFRHSQNFVVTLLHGFLEKGGKLYTYDGDKEMVKEAIDGFIRQEIVPSGRPARQVQPAAAICR